jgi:hypothetical protein
VCPDPEWPPTPAQLARSGAFLFLGAVSRAELAWELSISESSVDEMVLRGVLPSPARQSARGPRWSRRAVETALALFDSPVRTIKWT